MVRSDRRTHARALRPSRAALAATPLALLSLLAITVASPAAARQAAAPKIAVVDLDVVFLGSPLGQKLRGDLEALERTTNGRLESHTRKIGELQQGMTSATGEERRTLARQLEDEQRIARRISEEAQRQALQMEQVKRTEFEEKLTPIFERLQEEQGYDLILNKAAGVVIFAGPAVEITQTVLERLTQGS